MTSVAQHFLRVAFCTVLVLAITLALFALAVRDRPLTAALIFLFFVLMVSAAWGFRYALFVSFLATLGFSWLVPPVGSFKINDWRDIFALVAFLVIGIMASHLSNRAQNEAVKANQRRVEAVAAQQRFRDLVNSVEGIVWEADAESFAFSFVSEQAERVLGYATKQWLEKPTFWKDHIHPDDRDWAVQFCTDSTVEKRNHDLEYRMVAADGRFVWVRDLVTVVVENGKATRLRGVMVDVTVRKQSEEALRRSEAYLAEGQKLSHMGSWAYSPASDKILYWSEEMYRIFGLDPQRGVSHGEEARPFIHPDDRDKVDHAIQKAFREKVDYVIDFRLLLPDGTVKYIQTIGHPSVNPTGEVTEYAGIMMDVTERRRAEEERKRAEEGRERLRQLEADLAHINRVSMLGELASSLAHELNQPIAAAITSANACLRWLTRDVPDLDRARAAVMRIEKDGSRAAEIIQRLRAFYRTGAPPQRELVDINELVGEMLELLQGEAARHSISLCTELAPQLPHVMADRVQFQQVLMNLMLNGIEAMQETSGELVIRTELNREGQVLTSVRDSGVGLSAVKADQIFNAFFTTKPQGTGMGLAITRSLVESHGGRVWATANDGPGATFHFTLPTKIKAHE